MKEKQSMLSELIQLSKKDGTVSEQEIGFIKQIGNMMGLSDSELLNLFNHPAPFNPPKDHFDRIVQFQRMVLLMNVDEHLDPKELEHLRMMGMRFGLNPDAINEVLKRMKDFPNNMIPPAELIKIYRKHLN